jgi:chaperonin GroEL
MALSRGINNRATEAVGDAITRWPKRSTKRASKEIEQVATIAGNNDPSIGKVLADAFLKVGKDGVITVEEGRGNPKRRSTSSKACSSTAASSRRTSSPIKTKSSSSSTTAILIHEEKISSNKKMIPLLEAISKANKPLLIIAEDIEGRGVGDSGRQQDAWHSASLCGEGAWLRRSPQGHPGRYRRPDQGAPIFKDLGIDLESVKLSDLGRAKKIRITSEETTIVDGAGKKDDIEGRARTDSRRNRPHRQRIRSREAPGAAGQAGGRRRPDQLRRRDRDGNEGKRSGWSRTRRTRPRPPWKKALCRAAASPCSAPKRPSISSKLTGDEKLGATIIRNVLDQPLASDREERRPRRRGDRQPRASAEG